MAVVTTMRMKLLATDGSSKTLLVSNPKMGLQKSDFTDFVGNYGDVYGKEYRLNSAYYVHTSETKIYDAAIPDV